MLVINNMLDYPSAEHGFYDEAGIGSKESVKKLLKLPKTMKDMLLMLHNEVGNKEDHLRSLRAIGFSHSRKFLFKTLLVPLINIFLSLIDLRMNAYIMDLPAGYVCRVKPTKEQKIPMTWTSFYETYIHFLMQVYKLKVRRRVKSTCLTLS